MNLAKKKTYIILSHEEYLLLEGLNGFCSKLYIILKFHMNWTTGLVQNISWAYLATCMEVELLRGSHHQQAKPTIKELRVGAQKLQKGGLIEFLSKERELIFKVCFSSKINKKSEQGINLSAGGGADKRAEMRGKGTYKKQNYKIKHLQENNFDERQIGRAEGRAAYHKINNINNTNIINIINVDLEKNDEEKAFLEFWKVYPRKDSKKRANEIFLKKKLYLHLETILQDLKQRKEWDGGRYTPLPTTYLSQERWCDETKGELNGNQIFQRPNSNTQQREQYWDCILGKNSDGISNEVEINNFDTFPFSKNREN